MFASPPLRRSWPGPRWWLIASIAFVLLMVACAIPAYLMFFVAMLATVDGAGAPIAWLFILVVVILVVVPVVGAVAIASAIEFVLLRLGRPDRNHAGGWRLLGPVLICLSPAIILPLWLIAFLRSSDQEERRELARIDAYYARPIVASDTAGFCAPPAWRMRGGLPEVTLFVRPRAPGSHRISLDALDHANHRFGFDVQRELAAGVDTLTLRIERTDASTDSVWWPIRAYDLFLVSDRPEATTTIDTRSDDSLFVFDRNGLRPARPADPTAPRVRP